MLIRCRGASAPSQPPPLRGRGTPSLFLQTASPANHNHGSAAWLSASPNTPRASPSVSNRPPIRAPFPPSGKGVGGKGRYARGYLGSDSVRSTDLFFLIIEGKTNPYPAQPATGVLGRSPKRVLVPFTRVKGTPRRRAVLTKFSIRLAPPKVTTDFFTNIPPSGDHRLSREYPAERRSRTHRPLGAFFFARMQL